MANCAFLGLGVMGYPMAGHLAEAGHAVRVWNRNNKRAKAWSEQYSGLSFESVQEAISGADFIMMCVGDDPDVFAVVSQILPSLSPNVIIIDHTTASADCARQCFDQAKSQGAEFIDAPISGGEAGAINGQLSVMCGGEPKAFSRAEPIIQAYSKAITYMGPSGAGQLTKMVNQICIAGLLQGLSEGVNFAQRAGLDIDTVLKAIGQGAAQSWQMDNRAQTMARGEYEFGFAVDWMRKDLRIALAAAQKLDAEMPVTKTVDEFYADVQGMGGGRWDTSSLLKRFDTQ